MGLDGVSQTSLALLRTGEESDQRCSLLGKSLPLLLQSSGETSLPRAGDEPGLFDTLLDHGTVWKSDGIQSGPGGTEPGNGGELKLSLSRTSEMKSTGRTLGVGREEGQGGVTDANQGLRRLIFPLNVVQTLPGILEDILQTSSLLFREIICSKSNKDF